MKATEDLVTNSLQNSLKSESDATPDGRHLRAERTRKSIIDAAASMITEGVLAPTAQQIADRAGVGIRSFFRHFDDMETLFLTADEESRDSMEALFTGGDRCGSLQERIRHAVERRSEGYEIHGNGIRASKAMFWRWKVMRKKYQGYQRGLRKDLDDWLPELKALPKAEREGIDAIASAEMWFRLREEQELSKQRSIEVVVNLLGGLIPNT